MIPESTYAEPTPEWCVWDAKRSPTYMGHLWTAVQKGTHGTFYSNAVNQRFLTRPDGWDGVSFWRSATIDGDTITIEFNENWRERFTNPVWRTYTLDRGLFLLGATLEAVQKAQEATP